MTTQASLAGRRITSARLSMSAWGASYAEVTLDTAATMTGAAALVLADLTVACTILSGGPTGAAGVSYYRLVSGAGGWGKPLAARSYANDAGVKLSTVLGDAAAAVGESFAPGTIDPKAQLGPYYVRQAGPACRLLELLSPGAWYVGEDGQTRLGARPASTINAKVPRVSEVDLARGTLTLASTSIASILPGLAVDGLTAVDVEHRFDAKTGLTSRIWGKRSGAVSRQLAAFQSIIDQLDPDRAFRGVYEYRIVTQDGERLNLQPVKVSTGMPSLSRVVVRPGVPGCKAVHALGARVLVGFVDADASRPVVLAFDDAEGPGFVPQSLALAGGGQPVGRKGDSVSIDAYFSPGSGDASLASTGSPANKVTLSGTITAGSPKVTSG